MKKLHIYVFALSCAFFHSYGLHAQPGSMTVENSSVTISEGTTELRFSEISYFGPNSHWEINGTLEIWSKEIWIAPTARFSSSTKIILL